MDSSALELEKCLLQSCKGPGVDLTGRATMIAHDCTIQSCIGKMCLRAINLFSNCKVCQQKRL